jgi:hypothetical protein
LAQSLYEKSQRLGVISKDGTRLDRNKILDRLELKNRDLHRGQDNITDFLAGEKKLDCVNSENKIKNAIELAIEAGKNCLNTDMAF